MYVYVLRISLSLLLSYQIAPPRRCSEQMKCMKCGNFGRVSTCRASLAPAQSIPGPIVSQFASHRILLPSSQRKYACPGPGPGPDLADPDNQLPQADASGSGDTHWQTYTYTMKCGKRGRPYFKVCFQFPLPHHHVPHSQSFVLRTPAPSSAA
jgi:hypothetical protein